MVDKNTEETIKPVDEPEVRQAKRRASVNGKPHNWTQESREKYKQSREYHAAYMREWKKDNPEKVKKYLERDRERYHLVTKHKTPTTYTEKHKRYQKKNRGKINAKNRHIYHTNRTKHEEYQKKWKAANPEKVYAMRKRQKLKAKYGISLEVYDLMYAAQSGRCANENCGAMGNNRGKGCLVVDHCHKTGKVRQLLCSPCNIALGGINDCPDKAVGLANYLRKHRNNAV